MIRFIVKHTSYDGNPAGDFVVRYQTLDADVPALQAVLLSGGNGMGAFERADLVGVEIVRAADQPGGGQ